MRAGQDGERWVRGGGGIHHTEIQNPSVKCTENCIYMYTHIYIYIHIYMSLHISIRLLKNTDCFTTIAPLTFIIIHSNFLIHTGVVEIGSPALTNLRLL